jgi:hypothetical protein
METTMGYDTSASHTLGWAYPAGAENDPRAPWNQADAMDAWDAAARDRAIELETDALADEGIEAGVIVWMGKDAELEAVLADWSDNLVHDTLVARSELARNEAVAKFTAGIAPFVPRYVDAWTKRQVAEFLETEADNAYDDRDA